MTFAAAESPRVPRWRRIAFAVVVVLAALVFLVLFGSAFAAFAPWLAEGGDGPPPGYTDPPSHRWHDAQWAAHTGLLLGGSLLALLRRPLHKPLLVQFLAVAVAVFAILALVFDGPSNLVVLIPIALVAALYPDRRALLDFSRPTGLSIPLLVIAVLAAVLMAPDAWDKLQLQIDDAHGDEHAEHTHWSASALLLLNLLVAGVLAATGRPGWRALGVIAGLAFVYLGLTLVGERLPIEMPRLTGKPRTAE